MTDGMQRARERAAAFNAKIDAERTLSYTKQRASAAERKISDMIRADTAKYAPMAHEAAARELGRYFAVKFLEKAEAELGEAMARYAFAVAEKVLRASDSESGMMFGMAPDEIKKFFYTIWDEAEHKQDVGVTYRPSRGGMAVDSYIERRLVWPKEVFAYRHVVG